MILLGENHMDPTGHILELELLQHLNQKRGEDKLTLSLEFYDREAQVIKWDSQHILIRND